MSSGAPDWPSTTPTLAPTSQSTLRSRAGAGAKRRRSSRRRGRHGRVQPGDAGPELLRGPAAHDPAIAVLRRALEGGVGRAAEDQRRPPLRRRRPDPPGATELLAGPDAPPLLEHLVEELAAGV